MISYLWMLSWERPERRLRRIGLDAREMRKEEGRERSCWDIYERARI